MMRTQGVTVPALHCAATFAELEAFGLEGASEVEPGFLWRSSQGLFAVTGVGIPRTVLTVSRLLQHYHPELLVNIGIAGAYDGSGLVIGDVVVGVTETFVDLGMETDEGDGFIPLGTTDFADESLRAPLSLAVPRGSIDGCKPAHGATVNSCAGTDATGARRRTRFQVDFESMEGAAAALVALDRNIPIVEIRAISNFAARRDMRPENIQIALTELSRFWKKSGLSIIETIRREQSP
jgi:futalosine hydrolase